MATNVSLQEDRHSLRHLDGFIHVRLKPGAPSGHVRLSAVNWPDMGWGHAMKATPNDTAERPWITRLARGAASACLLSLLAACAGHAPIANSGLTASQEAAVYKSHARASYAPPGPPGDPWGPYVAEASRRFDVPDVWIREVMHVESGGYQFRASGALTTSPVGAMGLMQLMPETYDEVRARYTLGDDAFDPHNNILAGAAYMREMYDAFGSPGFLAAYNAGPARLSDYLTHNRPLPDETRRYVYMIGTRIEGAWPVNRSPNEQLAVNRIPVSIPAGPRWVVHHRVLVASRGRRGHEVRVRYAAYVRHGHAQAPVEVAYAPEPRVRMALAEHRGGIHLISPAMASESMGVGGHHWAVQVGTGGAVHGKISHTRVGGMTRDAAVHTCQKLAHHKGGCVVVSPAAQ